MKLRIHAATDIGRVRQNNEDSFLVDEATGVFAVADGLGGLEGGELASRTAVETIKQALRENREATLGDLPGLVQKTNTAVLRAGRKAGILQTGTTLTLAHIDGNKLRIVHVGDSFALLIRGGECRALTNEHNVENENNDALSLAPYPPSYRYALTRVIGQTEPLRVDLVEETLAAGDWLVLATDGLTDRVPMLSIAEACASAAEPGALVAELVQAALEMGGHDNITVTAIHVAGE